METERTTVTVRHPEAKPTPKQVYVLAHELCTQAGEEFPATRGAASALIQRLRVQNGKGRDV
jgi:hypothetical protein